MNRISIIGFGKLAKEIIRHIIDSEYNGKINIVTRNLGMAKGFLLDYKNSKIDSFSEYNKFQYISINSDYDSLKSSDLIIITVGTFLTQHEKEKIRIVNSSGRLIQSIKNKEIICKVAKQVQMTAPLSTVLVCTNQSDLMSELFRVNAPQTEVLGYGVMADNYRFKMLLKNFIEKTTTVHSLMIGSHSEHIEILNRDNLFSDLDKGEIIEKTLKETIDLGKRISELQSNSNSINSGSSILHGYCICEFVLAYFSIREPLIESFNVRLPSEIVDSFGVPSNTHLSIPIKIYDRKICFDINITYSAKEKDFLFKTSQVLVQWLKYINDL